MSGSTKGTILAAVEALRDQYAKGYAGSYNYDDFSAGRDTGNEEAREGFVDDLNQLLKDHT